MWRTVMDWPYFMRIRLRVYIPEQLAQPMPSCPNVNNQLCHDFSIQNLAV